MMKLTVQEAIMGKEEDGSYIGKTVFIVEGHKSAYEITFVSKRGKDWDYSLHFAKESGDEEELFRVDERIEQDDDWFDELLDAALNTLPE